MGTNRAYWSIRLLELAMFLQCLEKRPNTWHRIHRFSDSKTRDQVFPSNHRRFFFDFSHVGSTHCQQSVILSLTHGLHFHQPSDGLDCIWIDSLFHIALSPVWTAPISVDQVWQVKDFSTSIKLWFFQLPKFLQQQKPSLSSLRIDIPSTVI